MKKGIALWVAGILSLTLVLGVACNGNGGEGGDPLPPPDRQAAAFASPDATLSLTGAIDATTKSRQISSDLFGIFLEDINYASYALDSNLVSNGSFEYAKNKTYGWKAEGATLTPTTDESLFKGNDEFAQNVNPTSARIVSAKAGDAVLNEGYAPVPMAIKEGTSYTFTAFVKTSDYSGDIEISVGKGATEYYKTKISVAKSNDWVKYSVTATATGSESNGLSLKLSFGASGTLYLDGVTLETNDSTIGIKNYLYEAIADLSPAFIRFPGGCVIEGKDMNGAYDWKNSIGATTVAGETSSDTVPAFTYSYVKDGAAAQSVTTYGERVTRVPNTDIWQRGNNYYEMEYGLGFYEYFLLCDNLGASAIPIVNCGMGCQTQGTGAQLAGRHGNKIQDYIQDAKDLICFAKGSVTSSDKNEAYWAQVRTNMGHAEPFEMDYIGIGNEQWGNYYKNYYEVILKALNDAATENPIYGKVKPIVGNCTMFEHCEYPETGRKGAALEAAEKYADIDKICDYGVIDQHYYMNYTDFFAAATDDFYKGYTRPTDGTNAYKQDDYGYYEVFVGEYSANSAAARYPDSGKTETKYSFANNSWITALSEAALMTTFESNGDIIKLAAYAPMFGNLTFEHNQWVVDMMFYDNENVVLTGNYFVQQLFMKNAGDHKIDAAISYASGETPTTEYKSMGSTTRTVNNVYYVASQDKETGDVIIKIVNAGEDAYNMNVSLSGLQLSNRDYAEVTMLSGADANDVSSVRGNVVDPEHYTIGGFTSSVLGIRIPEYSVCAIRVRTK